MTACALRECKMFWNTCGSGDLEVKRIAQQAEGDISCKCIVHELIAEKGRAPLTSQVVNLFSIRHPHALCPPQAMRLCSVARFSYEVHPLSMKCLTRLVLHSEFVYIHIQHGARNWD